MLEKQWEKFCKNNNARGDHLKYFEEIKRQYSVPKRFYHTLEGHVAQGMEVFEEFNNLCENSDLVYYSWLLHDIFYDSKAKDNEERSAGFAYHLAIKMGFAYNFAKSSHGLILITKHIRLPKTTDEKFVIDIDLSIFGQEEKIFDEYERSIRKEYEWVEEETFKTERAKILQRFLDKEHRKHIYLTDFFRNKYEEKAEENLKRSIEKLSL